MKIEFVENNYKISKKFKEVITNKLEKFSKYFDGSEEVKVLCSEQNRTQKLELTIVNKGVIYRSEASSDEMYNNIDIALPKIERQIVRNKDKKIAKAKVKATDKYAHLEDDAETSL